MPKRTLDELVFFRMLNGEWWTFWNLKKAFETKNYYYGEPSISAAIRNLSKDYNREKFGLPKYGDIYIKRRQFGKKGYEYKLTNETLKHIHKNLKGVQNG